MRWPPTTWSSGLLIVHGLHPYPVEQRVEAALERVRPYLGSHGGDVELLGVDDVGVVRLRLLGSCDGCPSSAVTLQLAVEGAVEDAAPEITGIEVETPVREAAGGLISIDSLRSRLGRGTGSATSSGRRCLSSPRCRPARSPAYHVGGHACSPARSTDSGSSTATCARGVPAASAGTQMSGGGDRISVRCPTCGTEYDVRRAGANIAGGPEHLDPLPALESNQEWRVAIPAPVSA